MTASGHKAELLRAGPDVCFRGVMQTSQAIAHHLERAYSAAFALCELPIANLVFSVVKRTHRDAPWRVSARSRCFGTLTALGLRGLFGSYANSTQLLQQYRHFSDVLRCSTWVRYAH
jgi:hypothetical protein